MGFILLKLIEDPKSLLLYQARLLIMLDWQLWENDIIVMFYSAGMVLSEFLMIY